MRNAGYGLLAGIAIAVAAVAVEFPQAQAQAQRTPPAERHLGGEQLIVLPFDGGDGKQQVTVVDPKTRVMAVYQVDKANGSLALRSVRNVQWDLLMEEYNTSHGSPTPRDIRALAEQR